MTSDQSENDTDQLSEDEIIRDEIDRAKAGDATAGRELLRSISLGLSNGNLHPYLAEYHADCLWNHLQLGISLERALHVYNYQIKSTAFDPIELAAVYELLVEFAGMKKGDAKGWIKSRIGVGKKAVENANAAVDIRALNSFDQSATETGDSTDQGAHHRERYLDLLLHMAGSMRKLVIDEVSLK